MKYPSQIHLPKDYVQAKFTEFLLEDAPRGDVTTKGIFETADIITGIIQAQEPLVFAGEVVLRHCFDTTITVDINSRDGEEVQSGAVLAVVKGRADELLLRERVLLNLLQRLCGIATKTRRYVAIAETKNVKILDTRKTTPGLRLFEKYAVAVGGGCNHRLDLSSGVLIKDNHITAAGGITPAVAKIRNSDMSLPIEVEVETDAQIKEALACRVDGLLLDNLTPDEIRRAVADIRRLKEGKDIFVEASGGITLENLDQFVQAGVDAISVGALTHSVDGSEIHMEFENA